MSVEWNSLPLLPLKCILDYLSVEDALAAMSTCRHWRQAMLLYEGRRDTMKLKAKQLNKNLFLTRLFRKHTSKLHIYIDCSEDQLNKFMNFVLPQFFDAVKLQEVVFVGPIYMQQNPLLPFAKLKRIITESLVFKHSHMLQKLAIMGCEMSSVKNDKDRLVHQQVEYYSKPLSFECVTSSADSVLCRWNIETMMCSSLKHIILEYDLVTTETLETLSNLSNLKQLSLNLLFQRQTARPTIDWNRVNARFSKGLDVAVNIISLSRRYFKAAIENVFVEGMPLTSLKVMFCKTLNIPLISHVACLYNMTLRELVWVDCPHEEGVRPIRHRAEEIMPEVYNQVNPFVLLCWQCVNIRRLVIHGYWVWQYDLLGFIRLRKSINIEISSLYANQRRFGSHRSHDEFIWRVMVYDTPPSIDKNYIQEVNTYSDNEWQPFPWSRLPAGLRANSSPENRANYIVEEVLQPLGIT